MTSVRPTTLFRDLPVPEGLLPRVFARIARAKRRAALLRLGGFGMVIVLLLAPLLSVIRYAGEELYESGFFEYLSLFFSDHGFSYWKEILLSLIDAIPSVALLALLSVSALLLWSFARAVANGRVAFASSATPAF